MKNYKECQPSRGSCRLKPVSMTKMLDAGVFKATLES